MNESLKELYYQDDVIIGSKQNFINIAKNIDPHEPAVHGAEYYTDSQQHIVAQAR